MKIILHSLLFLFSFFFTAAQTSRSVDIKYPSLLWEIKGNGLSKPSYLFGTMHVSSKIAFHLSDSFYLGIKNADVVGLETNPETWQMNMNKYDISEAMGNGYWNNKSATANDFLKINSLRFEKTDKLIEQALNSNPSIINSLLYRANNYGSNDFEEDTYLDMHIFQVGRKWGKKVAGVESFDESMRLMMEAYADGMKDEKRKEKATDISEEFSSGKLQDAYRLGNLDLVDTITKLNSMSAAFDEKFLYKRNELQANSIDSILRSGSSLFVGVGAAHLAGQRGVIEMLRKRGYKLRPIKMTERDSRYKDEIEKLRVPVSFAPQTVSDDFIKVQIPGQLYGNKKLTGSIDQQQFADMSNGSYYMITRVQTNAALWGNASKDILRQVDSVLYENIPGKIISKKTIVKNGYEGFDIVNKTRRGDFQRYQIFTTPYEVIFFKMSGTAEYVTEGTEGDKFFNSIELKEYATNWKKFIPAHGGFEINMPHQPFIIKKDNWQYIATDKKTGNTFQLIRTDVHNYNFAEEDTFDLNLMEESFASSEFIDKAITKRRLHHEGLPALDVTYKHKSGSVSMVRYLIHGPHYYTLIAHGKAKGPELTGFLNSFVIRPLQYGQAKKQADTAMHFTVSSPVAVTPKELEALPFDPLSFYNMSRQQNGDDSLLENGDYKYKMISQDTTGEKIYVTYYKAAKYFFDKDSTWVDDMDSEDALENWVVRMRTNYELPRKMRVWEYIISDSNSSRAIKSKLMYSNGVAHMLSTQIDTSAQQSSFITEFFKTFTPDESKGANDIFIRKSALYFGDFFSKDTIAHKRALKNITGLFVDSSDFSLLKKSIQSLSWKEKMYIDVKKDFINKLGEIKTQDATNYLRALFIAAGDTLELQHTVLENLLRQQTVYSFQTFKDIVLNDPPVLSVEGNNNNSSIYRNNDEEGGNGAFMDELNDSLKLTATIFKDLLPLMNIDDYKQPVMQLLGVMVDSNLVPAKDYEMYLQKFLLEAKQEWKKQSIVEKNKSIDKAQETEEEERFNNNSDESYGNEKLNLYATLLLPFWETNTTVPAFISQLFTSTDKRFKYDLAYLLMRKNKPLPDTLLRYYAGIDEYRYEVYTDLNYLNLQHLLPNGFKNTVALAKGKLLNITRYENPADTLAYLEKTKLTYRGKSGHFYFFKYKSKKTDNYWKIATVGLVPADGKRFEFMDSDTKYINGKFNFTGYTDIKITDEEPLKVQLQKALKRQLYSKRSSAQEFYEEEKNWNFNDE